MSNDVDPVGLLATAVAGRVVPVAASTRGIHTDGASLFLPPDADPRSPNVRHAVLCQASLLASYSLAPMRMKRLARAGALASDRYLALEVVRSCVAVDRVLPSYFRAAIGPYVDAVGLTASADESLERALSRRSIPRAPAWFGELHPRPTTRGSTSEQDTDEDLAEALRRAAEEDEDDGDGSSSQLTKVLSSPVKNPLGSLLLNLLGARRSAGGGDNGGAEVSIVGRRDAPGRGPSTLTRAVPPSIRHDDPTRRGHRYPEWDHRRGQYRDDWCTVAELDPATGDEVGDGPVFVGRADARLLREIAPLSRAYETHHRQLHGGELDLDALVAFRTGVAAGVGTEPNVYQADLRTRPDLGVLVLLDATGSTADHAGATSVFDTQRELASALTTAFDQLGVRVASYAFYSRGRGNVRFLRCKTFDERWGVAAQDRMARIVPTGFTRLGAAVRHATQLLTAQAGTERRLLVVVGDGIAYDDGYEGPYAVEDARRSVVETAAAGVACVGISAVPPPDGQSVWSPDALLVATDCRELSRHVRALLGTALHHAGRPTPVTPARGAHRDR